jgi:hypothetical protein
MGAKKEDPLEDGVSLWITEGRVDLAIRCDRERSNVRLGVAEVTGESGSSWVTEGT